MNRTENAVDGLVSYIVKKLMKSHGSFPSRGQLESYLKNYISQFTNLYYLVGGRFILGHNEEVISSVSKHFFA